MNAQKAEIIRSLPGIEEIEVLKFRSRDSVIYSFLDRVTPMECFKL